MSLLGLTGHHALLQSATTDAHVAERRDLPFGIVFAPQSSL
jgi:hypothetical protein